MMCTTVLHGGACHRTSTPHKSENKMKEKNKVGVNFVVSYYLPQIIVAYHEYQSQWKAFLESMKL